MHNSYSYFVLASLLIGSQGQQETQKCHTDSVTPAHFFDINKILGTWYEYQAIAGASADATKVQNYRCRSQNISIGKNLLTLNISQEYVQVVNNKDIGWANAYCNAGIRTTEAQPITSKWEIFQIPSGTKSGDIVNLQTDYNTFLIQYGCSNVSGISAGVFEAVTIWTRNKAVDNQTLSFLQAIATGYGFPLNHTLAINNENCPMKPIDDDNNSGSGRMFAKIMLPFILLLLVNF